jgi:hypothetical protein
MDHGQSCISAAIYADEMGDQMRDSDWPQRSRIESFRPASQTSVERLIEKYNYGISIFLHAPLLFISVSAILSTAEYRSYLLLTSSCARIQDGPANKKETAETTTITILQHSPHHGRWCC